MKLVVNGEQRTFESTGAAGDADSGFSVEAMLEALGLSNKRVAVEVNRRIVKRATYAQSVLKDGDAVEIVHFAGGG